MHVHVLVATYLDHSICHINHQARLAPLYNKYYNGWNFTCYSCLNIASKYVQKVNKHVLLLSGAKIFFKKFIIC